MVGACERDAPSVTRQTARRRNRRPLNGSKPAARHVAHGDRDSPHRRARDDARRRRSSPATDCGDSLRRHAHEARRRRSKPAVQPRRSKPVRPRVRGNTAVPLTRGAARSALSGLKRTYGQRLRPGVGSRKPAAAGTRRSRRREDGPAAALDHRREERELSSCSAPRVEAAPYAARGSSEWRWNFT